MRLAKLGLSVSVFVWLFISFISASAAVICVKYAGKLWSFKAPDFIALVQKSSFILNIPPLFYVWRRDNISPSMPSSFEWMVYLLIGIVGAGETYIKSLALTLLPGSTYVILFESDLIWNVILSVVFLRRCYHPLQFISTLCIAGSVFVVTFSGKQTAGAKDPTGMGQFGGILLAAVGTFLTSLGAIMSDKLLKMMVTKDVKVRKDREHTAGLIAETGDIQTGEMMERSKSKVWYQNMEEVRNLEFTFWSSFLTFVFLIVWTLVDPNQEYKSWPSYFDKVRSSATSPYSAQLNMTIFIITMLSLAFARLFVRLSMNHLLMVFSAFFFSVWKPFRRIGTTFISIWMFGDSWDIYKGLAILLDTLGLLCFAVGGYLYRIQKKKGT